MTARARRPLAALVCALGAVATVGTACTSGSSGSSGGAGSSGTGGPASVAAPDPAASGAGSRWWQDGDDYCTILRATLRAGGAASSTPAAALAATTTSLLAALQRSAPSAVQASWATYAPALEALTTSGGDPSALAKVDRKAVAAAATAIATDAKSRCHLDLGA